MQKVKKTKTRLIGVYSVENPEGKFYIGSSINIYARWHSHGALRKQNSKLVDSFIKYGKKNHKFKIVHLCKEEDLKEKEIIFQRIYKSVENGLNAHYANQSIRTFAPMSEESICKMRKTKTGVKLSEEHKKKVGDALRGVKKKPFTEEHKLKISQSKKGAKLNLSDEQRLALSLRAKKIDNNNKKRVICSKTNVEYESIAYASRILNINEGTLRYWLKNPDKNKTTLLLN